MLGARGGRRASRPDRPIIWAIALAALAAGIGYQEHDGKEYHGSVGTQAGRQTGKGRQASFPSEIPAAGWKDILRRVYQRLSRDRILTIAAGVTFYILLAIFPAIAALVSIFGLFADPATVGNQIGNLSGVLPGGAIDVITAQANRVASQSSGTLGWAFVISLVISIWSANAGVKATFDALNVAYGEEEKRGFIELTAISLLFTVSLIIFAILAIAVVVVLPNLLGALGLSSVTQGVIQYGKWVFLLLALVFLISFFYRFGPSRDRPRWRWLSWGSAFAAIGWLGVSILFAWYVSNFGSYNKTYGSLGAVIGFMTWVWLSIIVVLIGAVLDAEMEHQTIRDTTTGRPEPLGKRGAVMADTVGELK